jgi:hypothetical protein
VVACGSVDTIDNDACLCVTCVKLKHRVDFSNRQWSKPQHARKCLSYIQHLMNNASKAGRILIREHAMRNRLVDGQLHDVTGKKVGDRAAHLSQQDKEEADRGMNSNASWDNQV